MHSMLVSGNMVIMASDMTHPNIKLGGNMIAVMINCSSEEEINTFFANLSVGGQIQDPVADMFWGAKFGALVDKFGFSWIVNYDKNLPV